MNKLSVWGKGEKSQGEGRERVRACRQTFGTAILPSCLVIADHLSVICHLDILECNQFHV